jgi:hypothetical protein
MGLFKVKDKVPVGAKEKIAAAQRIREANRATMLQGGKARQYSQTIPVTIIFVLAVAIAMFVTDDGGMLAGWRPTGIHTFDRILTGSEIPFITGDREMDRLVVVLIRGAAFFVAAGLIPLLALVLVKITTGRINSLVACWILIVAAPGLLYLWKDLLLPAFSDIVGF